MAIEKKQETTHDESQKQLSSQTDEELCFLVLPPTFDSLRPPSSSTDAIITINDDEEEEETLEPKDKKPILGSWWDEVEAFNELSSVVKGLPKKKDDNDAESRVLDSCVSSTDPHEKKDDERSLSSGHREDFIGLSEDESIRESTSNGNKGNRHVSLEESGVTVEDLKSMSWEAFDPTWEIRSEIMDPWLGGYVKDMLSPHH